jgi:crotonyl-CoA carboxylase/reductase
MATQKIYELGDQPPLGTVPEEMYAQLIRQDRFGEPTKGFKVERVPIPELRPDDVLVYVMAAGINYNNVWASLGSPVDVIKAREREGDKTGFHIGGSDASGIVYAVGSDVKNVKVGDRVVIHCGTWDRNDPVAKSGGDPMYGPTFRIWGYETNWGSFAQFTRVQAHQCLPKPKHLTWEAAAAYMLVGATAYRMLMGWAPHTVEKDDVVLVWGGAGGLGCQAIQIAAARGAIPVAVISGEEKHDFCVKLGAKGTINRKKFDHWGMMPHWKDNDAYNKWLKGARAFGSAIWDVVGSRKSPRIVFEHPGEDTVPTSVLVCDTGGMVVICAGTTGYNAVADLRYLWMRQKRLQGSHFANDEQSAALNDMVIKKQVDPCLSEVGGFDDIPRVHQAMYENRHPHGNMACLVGAKSTGLGVGE